eukprot:CAMPEP_0197003592 /NCGR_PEP_ID=MMETSP1380-20130617/8946_1 /TAXON_ID=5936 /ORGANISM="Euplotes crassus, Strain CT5" /LENGTH=48 /DNA_ID= /DNA_START= /DNA_END= /DNA_ORIENTATION=
MVKETVLEVELLELAVVRPVMAVMAGESATWASFWVKVAAPYRDGAVA